jgi:hypothetical protein
MESPAVKMDLDRLPKIKTNRNEREITSCVVDIIDKGVKVSNDKAKNYYSCIPDDLILSIQQADQPKEYLGPISKRTLQGIKPVVPNVTRRPDNAWNYEKQREKFKFLTEQPICSCGAGKDISFIYDCELHSDAHRKVQKPSKYDSSAVRAITNETNDQVITISIELNHYLKSKILNLLLI